MLVPNSICNLYIALQSMSLLLQPFGVCAEFLTTSITNKMLKPGMEKAVVTIQALEEKDFKEKVCVHFASLDSLYIFVE